MGIKTANCASSLELALLQIAGLLGIQRVVFDLKCLRLKLKVTLRIKQYLGTNTLPAKNRKSRIDRDPC